MPKRLCDLKTDLACDEEFCREYDARRNEFSMARALISARAKAGLSQADVAERMGVSESAVAKLEAGKPDPSLKMLRRYAHAVGCRLAVRLESCEES
jgi:DNA-binding XRE family transcriptional regulator